MSSLSPRQNQIADPFYSIVRLSASTIIPAGLFLFPSLIALLLQDMRYFNCQKCSGSTFAVHYPTYYPKLFRDNNHHRLRWQHLLGHCPQCWDPRQSLEAANPGVVATDLYVGQVINVPVDNECASGAPASNPASSIPTAAALTTLVTSASPPVSSNSLPSVTSLAAPSVPARVRPRRLLFQPP